MKIILTAVLLLGSYCLLAQPGIKREVKRDKSFKKAIATAGRYIDSLQTSQHIPGISICVGTFQQSHISLYTSLM